MRKLNELKEACADQKPTVPKYGMTFGEWLDFWYQNDSRLGLRPTTQQYDELMLYKYAIPALGMILLKKLPQSDLQRFFNKMK